MTAAFARYIAPARARPQPWRLLAGLVLTLALFALWVAVMFGVAWVWNGRSGVWMLSASLSKPDTQNGMLLVLASFAGLLIGPILAVRWLHGRAIASLFGRAPVVLRDFLVAVLVVAAVYSFGLGLWGLAYDAVPNLPLATWAAVLPLALAGLLVQTLAEEILFRGYMMQQLAARFASPVIWMGLPTVGFALLHFDPAANGGNTWLIIAAVGLFGLIAADLTRRSGSLGAAWGLHFANNVAALVWLSTDGTLTGLALFRTPYLASDPMDSALIGDGLVLLAVWFILSRLLRR